MLKIFWGACLQAPINSLGLAGLNLGLEKSGKSQRISYCLENGNLDGNMAIFNTYIMGGHSYIYDEKDGTQNRTLRSPMTDCFK